MALLKEINEKVYRVIGACMEVHRTLGPGLPPEFYRKALEVELPLKDLSFESNTAGEVKYKDEVVGTLEIDFVVDNSVILTVRSQDSLKDVEVQQVLRSMSIKKCSIGILVNFGNVKIQYKRILPSQQQRDVRKESYRSAGYREKGRTREGNPAI
jgi:GxxExxY protein